MKYLAAAYGTLIVMTVGSSPAYAYIDPASGSFLLQILAAIGLGAAFYFRRGLAAVKRFFGIKSTSDQSEKNDQRQEDDK